MADFAIFSFWLEGSKWGGRASDGGISPSSPPPHLYRHWLPDAYFNWLSQTHRQDQGTISLTQYHVL